VIKDLQKRKEEAGQYSFLENDLQRIEAQLTNRLKQKCRIWRAFELTGDEETFKRDIALVEEEIRAFQESKAQLESQIAAGKRYQLDVDNVKAVCELVNKNLETLSFDEKRSILEDLAIKVWVDGQFATIEGNIPIVSTSSRLPRQRWRR